MSFAHLLLFTILYSNDKKMSNILNKTVDTLCSTC
nr:MAG TPA: hypothetical protein [Caudoviricetes sp.]